MKIGLCGAPCTGKTTLAKAVAEKLNLTFIGESFEGADEQCEKHDCGILKWIGEPWPEYFNRVWGDTDRYSGQIISFTKGLAWDLEEKEKSAGDNFITDSAAPSQIVSALLYNTFLENEQSLIEWNINQAKRIEHYDYLYYLPTLGFIESDNRRPTNWNLQKAFDFMLKGVLDDIDKPSVEIMEFSTLEERVEFICSQVKPSTRGLIQ
jgi:AAA domain-containing protein